MVMGVDAATIIADLRRKVVNTKTHVMISEQPFQFNHFGTRFAQPVSARFHARKRHIHLVKQAHATARQIVYEGGIRVPFIARWPGRILGGIVRYQPAFMLDLFLSWFSVRWSWRPLALDS